MNAGMLAQTHLAIFPLIAFGIFATIFFGTLAWIYRPGARAIYERRSRMALDDTTAETTQAMEGRHVQP